MDLFKIGTVVKYSHHALRGARAAIGSTSSARFRTVFEIDYEVQRDRLGIVVEVDPSPYGKGYGVVWINPPGRQYITGRPYRLKPFYSSCIDYHVERA